MTNLPFAPNLVSECPVRYLVRLVFTSIFAAEVGIVPDKLRHVNSVQASNAG